MPSIPSNQINAVRRFNRFYTREIGALDAAHLGSRFSITEVRVLYELAHRKDPTASELAIDLGLDAGYLSRMLKRFERMKLLTRTTSAADRRATHLRLTKAGRATFAPLDKRASSEVGTMLARLKNDERDRLLGAMDRIARTLAPATHSAVTLREPRAGDMGWIVHRHGALYAAEYGYGTRFEAIVARVVADFVDHFDPKCERCWIADRDGEILGSIFLVRKTRTVAKLRLLYLEPRARGLGLGRRLVDECIAFAREAGYRKITLWTQSSLTAARHIYQSSGFVLKGQQWHTDFGPREAAETWELTL